MKLIRFAVPTSALFVFLQLSIFSVNVHAASVPKHDKLSEKAPAKQHTKTYTIEQFMATSNIGGASFSPDEKKILFNSNESGIFNAYTISIGGGKPVALTKSSTDSTYAVGYFHHDERILFTRDKGGDENNHLFVRELDGTEKDLTPGEKLKAEFFGWKPDGSAFYVQTNERDAKFFDVYRYDAKTYARSLFYKNESGMTPSDISRDEKWIALNKSNTTSDSDIYLYNTVSKEAKHITPHKEVASHKVASFDPESKRLFYTSNAGAEFSSVHTYDLSSGVSAEHEKANWDVAETNFSHDGRYRITLINQDGSVVVRVVEGKNEKPVALPVLPGGEMRSPTFSDSGKLLAFYINGDRSPNNLYVHDFSTKQTKTLTESLSKEINPLDLVEAEVVRFKSFDGMVIPSIYYKPKVRNQLLTPKISTPTLKASGRKAIAAKVI